MVQERESWSFSIETSYWLGGEKNGTDMCFEVKKKSRHQSVRILPFHGFAKGPTLQLT
jgi:hypothetical protein